MNILIAGAGPAGLYLAYLLKRQDARHCIRIVEQNPPDSTFGFGVVFSDRALDFLRDDDEQTHALIVPAMQRWRSLNLVHRGQRITIDGVGFAAIGRLQLLQLLQQRLASVGVQPLYHQTLGDAAALAGSAALEQHLATTAEGYAQDLDGQVLDLEHVETEAARPVGV